MSLFQTGVISNEKVLWRKEVGRFPDSQMNPQTQRSAAAITVTNRSLDVGWRADRRQTGCTGTL